MVENKKIVMYSSITDEHVKNKIENDIRLKNFNVEWRPLSDLNPNLKENINGFEIKPLKFFELAMMYRPGVTKKQATFSLRAMIDYVEPGNYRRPTVSDKPVVSICRKKLIENGFTKGKKNLLPKHIRIIIEHCGLPTSYIDG